MQEVERSHYKNNYDSKERFNSYWHQAYEIINLKPFSILEVGVGNGFLSKYLRSYGLNVTTIDHDPNLNPDVIASVISLPLGDSSFDVVAAYEILEHLPFEESLKGLAELYRVSKKHVIISLPESTRFLRFEFPIPKIKKVKKLISLPFFRYSKPLYKDHFWEIGQKGHTLEKFSNILTDVGFKIRKTYRVFENPRHRFFLLEKTKSNTR